MPTLVVPSLNHHRSFLAAVAEDQAEGRYLDLGVGVGDGSMHAVLDVAVFLVGSRGIGVVGVAVGV